MRRFALVLMLLAAQPAWAIVNEVTARNDYVGNGSATVFTYGFKILTKSDIEVLLDGAVKTVDTDYSVGGLGNDAGGAVTFVTAPATSVKVTLLRKQPVKQSSVYTPNEAFPAKRLEGDLDKQAMIDQQQSEAIARAIKLKKQSTESNKTFDDLAGNAGKFARVKTDASGFDYATVTSSGSLTLPVAIGDGGTGGTTAAAARSNLSVPSTSEAILNTLVTTRGDLIAASATSTPARKALGAKGAVLASDGTDPQWQAVGSNGTTPRADSAASNGLTYGAPGGYIFGLTLSNNVGDAVNDIDVAAGEASSDDALYANRVVIVGAALTKQLDAAWAVGTNQGCRDTGAISNATWHIYVIMRPDTSVSDVLCSLSATAPTMPTNYTKKRRIGAILRESGTIVAFSQDGDEFLRKATILDVNEALASTALQTKTISVPTGIIVTALIQGLVATSGTGSLVYVKSPSANDEAPSNTVAPLFSLVDVGAASGNDFGAAQLRIKTNTSAQINYRASVTSGTIRLATLGWIDRRGRDN